MGSSKETFKNVLQRFWARSRPSESQVLEARAMSVDGEMRPPFAMITLEGRGHLGLMYFSRIMEQQCRAIIRHCWGRGISEELSHGECSLFKLNGMPWTGLGEDAVSARRLVRALLAGLYLTGWVLNVSTDIFKSESERENLILRRKEKLPTVLAWGSIAFIKADRTWLIDMPQTIIHQLVQNGTLMNLVCGHGPHPYLRGVYELKYYRDPWRVEADQFPAMAAARSILLMLGTNLEVWGWHVYASVRQNLERDGLTMKATDTWHCYQVVAEDEDDDDDNDDDGSD